MTGRIPMTIAGHQGLIDELKRLKRVERPANVRDIETAREHGDISENAEFSAAKEKQAHLDGRMKMIEDQLARAEVIDISRLSGSRPLLSPSRRLMFSAISARLSSSVCLYLSRSSFRLRATTALLLIVGCFTAPNVNYC